MVNQWCRIRRMDPNKLTFKVYEWSINNNNTRYKNWALRVKDMFHHVGLNYNFAAEPDTLSKGYIQETINTHLKAQYNDDWKTELEREHAHRGSGRNKLRTYRQLKGKVCQYHNAKISTKFICQVSNGSGAIKARNGNEHLTENRWVCLTKWNHKNTLSWIVRFIQV